MASHCLSIALLAHAGLGLGAPAITPAAQEPAPTIERILVQGNRFLEEETYLFYVSSRPGDVYDLRRLRDDFRRLWDTSFLDDLALDVTDGSRGKIVTFLLRERRRVQIVDYRGSRKLKRSEIEDALKEKDAELRIDSFYDARLAERAESVIRDLLAAEGYQFARVEHDTRAVGPAGLQLSFDIEDGPPSRVKEIRFVGNEAFSAATLRRQMKRTKQPSLVGLTWLTGKTRYTPEGWEEDAESLRDFYLSRGHVDARVGTPTTEYAADDPADAQATRRLTLTIPVEEGPLYRLGNVELEGLTIARPEWVRSLVKLQEGDVYDDSRVQKVFERLQEFYGALGYFQFTGYTERRPDPERGVVDVTLHFDEDEKYYVGKISFAGNDSTRDKVIRREVFLNEGDPFNTELLKLSIKRLNQLGYFAPIEEVPRLAPSDLGKTSVDLTFQLREQNRNQFTLGGGVSGLEGTFVNTSFQTSNFIGRGETVNLAVQTGSRSRNYRLALTTPYFLDRPITAGVDVYLSRLNYLSYGTFIGFGQQTQGLALTAGWPVGRFARALARYSYQIVDVYEIDQRVTTAPTTGVIADDVLAGTSSGSVFDIETIGGGGRRYESAIMPTWARDTVDDQFRPRSGTRLTASLQVAGGILGGNLSYLRPSLEAVAYHPVGRHMALGTRAEFGYIRAYGNTVEIPYYQRYFLGGENQIRGYNLRSVAPFDPETGVAIGGDKFTLFNAEYYFELPGPLRLLAFFDAGQAYEKGAGLYWKTMSTSTGLELRMVMPVLNVPFRLIYAWNPNRDHYQPPRTFKFAIGTTF